MQPLRKKRFPVGMRTIKTAIAVVLAMMLVDRLGTTADKLIFAMLAAMATIQPTFRETLQNCGGQIVGVAFGAVMGICVTALPLDSLLETAIGIVITITLNHLLFPSYFSPSLPCFVLVLICVSPNIVPYTYALGRIWDTSIGLMVGLAVNVLLFPYDNSRDIRLTVESLNKDVVLFLEDLFDGDNIIPPADRMADRLDTLEQQLGIFANQKFIVNIKRQKQQLMQFQLCEQRASELVAHLIVLSHMKHPGRLTPENRHRLEACGAVIRDNRPLDSVMEADVVTNYHVTQVLSIRQELLKALENR